MKEKFFYLLSQIQIKKPLKNFGLTILLVVAVALLVWGFWQVPKWMINDLKKSARGISIEKRIELESDARKTLAQIVAGFVVALGIYAAWRRSDAHFEQVAVSQEANITERFTKAIEQLANKESLAIRLGGIYALERIAKDSSKDLPQIVEVLTAFVRENCSKKKRIEIVFTDEEGNQLDEEGRNIESIETDIQAILTVLGRMDGKPEMDLSELDLNRANLRMANLKGINFSGANLFRANFLCADLTEANFVITNLCSAEFAGVILVDAELAGGNLQGAHLGSAKLERANLWGTDLKNTFNLTAKQIQESRIDRSTILPTNLKVTWTSDNKFTCEDV